MAHETQDDIDAEREIAEKMNRIADVVIAEFKKEFPGEYVAFALPFAHGERGQMLCG